MAWARHYEHSTDLHRLELQKQRDENGGGDSRVATMADSDAGDIRVVRPALTVAHRSQKYRCRDTDKRGVRVRVNGRVRTWCQCSRQRVWESMATRLPILDWLPRYSPRAALLGDFIGGATVGIMHIPQGMAYALLAGLPPITGLYMAFFPVLIYVFLGTSHHVSMGTFAVACLMMEKVVGELSTVEPGGTASPPLSNATVEMPTNDSTFPDDLTTRYTSQQVAAVLALMVGIWEVSLAVVQLGELFSMFLSDMLVSGFTTGVAFHVLTSQVKYLFGVPVPRYNGPFKLIYTYWDLFQRLASVNPAVLIMSAVSIVILVFNNEVLKPRAKKYTNLPIPIELLVVVVGTAVSYLANLEGNYGVRVIGDIPTGLPTPSTPPVELLPDVAVDAFIIGVVGYTSTFSMSKIFARRQGYSVDATQELYAQGLSNMFGSFFSCGPMAASLSRSLIQEAVGAATLLTALISCVFIVLILLFVGPAFETLPNCVLASIIVVSLKALFLQLYDLVALWAVSRLDALIWLATFAVSVVVDIDYGLMVGVGVSLVVLLARSQRPPTARLGHIPHTDLYLDVAKYDMAVEVAGVRIFQFGGALNFANAAFFRSKLLKSTGLDLAALTEARVRQLQQQDNPQPTTHPPEPEPTVDEVSSGTRGNRQEPPADHAQQEPLTKETHTAYVTVPDVQWLVVEMSGVTYVDTMGARHLRQLHKDLRDAGITLCLAAVSDRVLSSLARCETLDAITRDLIFHSTHDAITVIAHTELNLPRQSCTNL
ncbi:prestin-like isoform X2 [Panulirus ornatus]|uniref:prestin-like isoform X2 n=1 Tax=Panulirus ornatus TaxID=150431 RepID=UPI003A8C86C0